MKLTRELQRRLKEGIPQPRANAIFNKTKTPIHGEDTS